MSIRAFLQKTQTVQEMIARHSRRRLCPPRKRRHADKKDDRLSRIESSIQPLFTALAAKGQPAEVKEPVPDLGGTNTFRVDDLTTWGEFTQGLTIEKEYRLGLLLEDAF